MNYTRIRARVTDQTIQLVNVPLIASGGQNEVRVDFNFCNKWNGLGKTAVFYQNPGEVYPVLMADDSAVVPAEVLAKDGLFYFGVFGIGADQVRTTEVVGVTIVKGAITLHHGEPTPDIYQQLMIAYGKTEAALAVTQARLDTLAAMRSADGSVDILYEPTAQVPYRHVISSGATARVGIMLNSVTVETGTELVIPDVIPDTFEPLGGLVSLTGLLNDAQPPNRVYVTLTKEGSSAGYLGIKIRNSSGETISGSMDLNAEYFLASVSIAELADLRIGVDGTVYPSAGAAVRGQIEKIQALPGGSASTPDHSMYFEIDVDGLVSLKPEYRGDSTDYYVNTGKYTFSESDRGIGYEGSKISELPERLVIPDNVNGEMVTGFQIAIFCCNKRIKEVVLPSSVKAISNGMFREAIHLEKVENTEQIETIGNAAFTYTRIEEIRFPNLATLGKQVFENCSCLRVIDVGKIASLGNTVFKWCENLTDVIGGENVKTIGAHTFFATRRLKRLSFLGNVTKIESAAFFGSRCDLEEVSDCEFIGTATYKQFNDTDYWTGVPFTPCRNPLNTVFHQRYPEWAEKPIGNLVDEKGEPLTYGYQGCAFMVLAEIYSVFENVHFDSPEEFTQILESKGLLLDFRYPDGWCQMAEGLGYTVVRIDTMTKENLQTVYEALAQGALVYRSIAVEKNGTLQTNGGHAILAYGVNSDGELLTTDTSSRCDNVGIYDNYKTAWHIYKHGDKECNVVIVKKKEG